MAIFMQSGGNALEVVQAIRDRMAELKQSFPPGVDFVTPFDPTRYVSASIEEVTKTFLQAGMLVILVVFVFLQSWRATLIPVIAVPVSLIGTFAGLWLAGFSINTLTLFAMVLSIGIVVDDAIVVLENVERLMREEKMSPFAAAVEAMREVSSAVIAIVLVLCAVFVPVAFLTGIAGALYRQFAVTVAIAVVISGFTALTLTPTLCALLLRDANHDSKWFRWFNRAFSATTNRFLTSVGQALQYRSRALAIFAGVIALAGLLFWYLPSSFVPPEDQGYLIGNVQLPDGATLERTGEVSAQFQRMLPDFPGFEYVNVINGNDIIGGGTKSSAATLFIILKPWSERDTLAADVAKGMNQRASAIRGGIAIAFNPPAIRGLGTAGGFEAYLQSRGSSDPARLGQVLRDFQQQLAANPKLTGINTFYRASRAATASRSRSREGAGARRPGQRRVRGAAEHDERALRQRLQRLRPHVPRADASRGAVPQRSERSRRGLRPLADQRPDDSAQGADAGQRGRRPGAARALQWLCRCTSRRLGS